MRCSPSPLVSRMSYLRLTRAVVLAERPKAYVQAAEIQGYSRVAHSCFATSCPNAIGPIAVQTSILAGVAILLEAMLSFLGLGVATGSPSWGAMLDDARRFQIQQPLLSLVPGAAITITVLAFNLLGDGFRDAFNSDFLNQQTQEGSAGRCPDRARSARAAKRRSSAVPTACCACRMSASSSLATGQFAEGGPRRFPFAIAPGEIYGLVGESGSGKSMTTSAILRPGSAARPREQRFHPAGWPGTRAIAGNARCAPFAAAISARSSRTR